MWLWRARTICLVTLTLWTSPAAADQPPSRVLSFEQWQFRAQTSLDNANRQIENHYAQQLRQIEIQQLTAKSLLSRARAKHQVEINSLDHNHQHERLKLESLKAPRPRGSTSDADLERKISELISKQEKALGAQLDAHANETVNFERETARLNDWKNVLMEERKQQLLAAKTEFERRERLAKTGQQIFGAIAVTLPQNDFSRLAIVAAEPAPITSDLSLAQSEIPPGDGWHPIEQAGGGRMTIGGKEFPAGATWFRVDRHGISELYYPLALRWKPHASALAKWVEERTSRLEKWQSEATTYYVDAEKKKIVTWYQSEAALIAASSSIGNGKLRELLDRENELRTKVPFQLHELILAQVAFRETFVKTESDRMVSEFAKTGKYDAEGLQRAWDNLNEQVVKFDDIHLKPVLAGELERQTKEYEGVTRTLARWSPASKAILAWQQAELSSLGIWFQKTFEVQVTAFELATAQWQKLEELALTKIQDSAIRSELSQELKEEVQRRSQIKDQRKESLDGERDRRSAFIAAEVPRRFWELVDSKTTNPVVMNPRIEQFVAEVAAFESRVKLSGESEKVEASQYVGVANLERRATWAVAKKTAADQWSDNQTLNVIVPWQLALDNWTIAQNQTLQAIPYPQVRARIAQEIEKEKARRQAEIDQAAGAIAAQRSATRALVDQEKKQYSAESEARVEASLADAREKEARFKETLAQEAATSKAYADAEARLQSELAKYPLPYKNAPECKPYTFGQDAAGRFVVMINTDGQPKPLLSLNTPQSAACVEGYLAIIGTGWKMENGPTEFTEADKLKLVILKDHEMLSVTVDFDGREIPDRVRAVDKSFMVSVRKLAGSPPIDRYSRWYDVESRAWDVAEFVNPGDIEFFFPRPE